MIAIDGYVDIERIGHGGLGDVYRATRVSTGSLVAIKVLRDVSDESVAWHRTRRELTALVALAGHGNVIQLLELLELPEGPALVMEYAPGGSVAGLLRDRGATLSVGEIVLIGRQTAAALVAAHAQGIVHRDIKPQNLLIDAYGQVKLCDFGVAALTRTDDFRTRTSALSMRYASPEDLDDEIEVGPPSDVYSLGATLLHLARGAPPTLKERLAPWVPPDDADDANDAHDADDADDADDGDDSGTDSGDSVADDSVASDSGTDDSGTDADMAALDEVIASCLHPDPQLRPTAAAVLDALERLDWSIADRRRSLVGREPAAVRSAGADPAPIASLPDSDEAAAGARPTDDATVHRPGVRPAPEPAVAPPRATRTKSIAAGLLAIAVLAGVAAFIWWPRDGDERSSSTTVAPPATSGAALTTTGADAGRTDVTEVPRPDGLVAIDDPAIVWPFGDPGECLVQQPDDEVLQPIDCDLPHDLQRFAVAELDDDAAGDPFDAAALRSAVDAACRAAFGPFVGVAHDDSGFDAPFTLPSEATWADGDRRYQCFLGVADSRLVGDATGIGR